MILIQTDFLDDPDAVVTEAAKWKYHTNSGVVGQRTAQLTKICPALHEDVVSRVNRLLGRQYTSDSFRVFFHKMNSDIGYGVPHTDPNELAGVVYLSCKQKHPDCGTSFFANPDGVDIDQYQDQKRAALDKCDMVDLAEVSKTVRSKLKEITKVSCEFNKAVIFDPKQIHASNDSATSEGDRLTLLFFVRGQHG